MSHVLADHGLANLTPVGVVAGGAGAAEAARSRSRCSASKPASRPTTSRSSASRTFWATGWCGRAAPPSAPRISSPRRRASRPAISSCTSITASAASSGCKTIEAAGAPHDCLEIHYAGGDKLFLPVENIELLSRYGSEETAVELDRLGGGGWQTRKARMKSRIREIAHELIKVAAERQLREAPRLTVGPGLYDEFCAGFPYEETDDQQAAIDAVLDDLAAGRPMDRLICGDVGFGKTEVALRAAFAAVMNGKQVAVVVPTTLLARQHTKTFTERFRGFPVKIGQASRLVSSAELAQRQEGPRRGPDRHRHRHPCAARQDHQVQGPRPRDRRRGAAFRRGAQGEAQAAARRGACADADRDADPAHLAARADRRARALDHRLAAGRSAGGAHLRLAVRSAGRARGAAARALSRRPGVLCLPAHRGPRRRQGVPRQDTCRKCASRSRTARCRRPCSKTSCRPSTTASTTCCCRPPSSNPASTSRPPIR